MVHIGEQTAIGSLNIRRRKFGRGTTFPTCYGAQLQIYYDRLDKRKTLPTHYAALRND